MNGKATNCRMADKAKAAVYLNREEDRLIIIYKITMWFVVDSNWGV